MRPHRIAGLYLAQRVRFGMKFGLETIRAVLAEMGHPERAFSSILIAGTNGKGSVAAYCDAVLRASGVRTGRYTSPHLVRVNERITVGGREITDHAFERAVGAVRDAASRLVSRGTIRAHPTFFEVLTAAAFEHFRRRRVAVAVVEVGLGGRLDATNVVEPVASAIVSVDFDHQVYLGHTLSAIAGEKAGVLRPNRATVLGPLPFAARRKIEAQARALRARLVLSATGARMTPGPDGRIDLCTPEGFYTGLRPLPGVHQRHNLLVAVRLLEEARRAGVALDLSTLPAAVARTRWPGRLERVPGRPPLLLDGAHNPAGARALAAHLRRGPAFVLVFGAMADKDVRGLARELFPQAKAIVLTRPPVPRAATTSELARRAGRLARDARQQPSVGRALALARRLAVADGPETIVVVAGSLYLVGAVEALIQKDKLSAGAASKAGEASRGGRPGPAGCPSRPGRSRAARERPSGR